MLQDDPSPSPSLAHCCHVATKVTLSLDADSSHIVPGVSRNRPGIVRIRSTRLRHNASLSALHPCPRTPRLSRSPVLASDRPGLLRIPPYPVQVPWLLDIIIQPRCPTSGASSVQNRCCPDLSLTINLSHPSSAHPKKDAGRITPLMFLVKSNATPPANASHLNPILVFLASRADPLSRRQDHQFQSLLSRQPAWSPSAMLVRPEAPFLLPIASRCMPRNQSCFKTRLPVALSLVLLSRFASQASPRPLSSSCAIQTRLSRVRPRVSASPEQTGFALVTLKFLPTLESRYPSQGSSSHHCPSVSCTVCACFSPQQIQTGDRTRHTSLYPLLEPTGTNFPIF